MADSSGDTPGPEGVLPVQKVAAEVEDHGASTQHESQEAPSDAAAAVNHEEDTAEEVDEAEPDDSKQDEDDIPPAIPSKDTEASQPSPRASVDDPSQFQDVQLSESQQEHAASQLEHQEAQETQGPPASSATKDVPERPRSDTVSTANGHAVTAAESPARPAGGAAVRPSRASSTYSTRTASTSAAGRKPLLQGVLVVSAYETILNSKDARRTPALKEAAQRALEILKAPASQSSSVHTGEDRRREVFEPLKLACETKTNAIMITALDAIGKLVSYGFFNPPSMDSESIQEDGEDTASTSKFASSSSEQPVIPDEDTRKLSDLVVDTICDCFIEAPPGPAAAALQAATSNTATPDAVNLQIVKAILTIVLQESNKGLSIHQSSLVSIIVQAARQENIYILHT